MARTSKKATGIGATITLGGLNALVSAGTIFDALCAQQGNYMKRHGVKEVLVWPKHLKYYAGLCNAAYQRQLKKAKTAKEHRALHKALAKRLKRESIRPEFLKAVPITALNSAQF